jgi:hypothetical protein
VIGGSVNVSAIVSVTGISVGNRQLKIFHERMASAYGSTLGRLIVRVSAGACCLEMDG